MIADLLMATLLLTSAASLTWRESVLSRHLRTWPPAPGWLLNIMYVVVCLQVSYAVLVLNRAFVPAANHSTLMGMALVMGWASYNVGVLANVLTHVRAEKMQRILAMSAVRDASVARVGKLNVLPGLDARDMTAAVGAVEVIGITSDIAVAAGQSTEEVWPRRAWDQQ